MESRQRRPFFPRADAGILTTVVNPEALPGPSNHIEEPFDKEGALRPIEPWSEEVERTYWPSKPHEHATAPVPEVPRCLPDRYLRAFLAKNEKHRMSMVWYYTGNNVLDERDLLFALQEKAELAREFSGWEYVVIGILDLNFFRRVVAVGGIPLGLYPRGETIASHTITWPSGSLFMLPNMIEDWRFRDHPIVTHGGLRAYAGAPLRILDESGEYVGLGSLCVASSSTQQELTVHQQQRLLRLADWIVADIVHATRAKRQRSMRKLTELLAKAERVLTAAPNNASDEPVLEILRAAFPDAAISVQPAKAGADIQIEGRLPISVAELVDAGSGIWEDFDYLEDFVAKSNHQQFPSDRVVRILYAHCDSISGPALLLVGRKVFPLVMDDIDSWFVHSCAKMLSKMWNKYLLAEALAAKERFLRGITHQLRTPIHGILGSADLLSEELKTLRRMPSTRRPSVAQGGTGTDVPTRRGSEETPADPAVYVETIKATGRDLICIVNSIITFSRWADVAMEERVDAMRTIDQLEADLAKRITNVVGGDTRFQASLIFHHDTSFINGSFCSDLRLLGETLAPLILNAIQNTKEGLVTVTTSLRRNAQSEVLIVDVEDTGRGIHADDRQRIFEPYQKVDMDTHGAGLGLTLATKFSTLLNGSVSLISSEVGRGSHFQATFNEFMFTPSTVQAQPMLQTLINLPTTFCILQGPNKSPLLECFAKLLIQRGYARSDFATNSFVILDSVADLMESRALLATVPPDQVAICLISIIEAVPAATRTSENIVFVSAPFTTSTLFQALKMADTLSATMPRDPQLGHLMTPGLSDGVIDLQVSPSEASAIFDTAPSPCREHSEESALTPASSTADDIPPVTLFPSLAAITKPTALIVDDNAINLRILQIYCKKRRLPFHCAADGNQAVEIFTKHQAAFAIGESSAAAPIQLVLMDLQMPVCDGIEATRQIRSLEADRGWARSVLAIVTGQDTTADRAAAEEAGADDYYVKPLGVKILDAAVRKHFSAFVIDE